MIEEAVKKLTRKGSMVEKDAADELDLETAERFEEISEEANAPMFVTEEMTEKVSSNKGFAEALHNNSRSKISRRVDENRQAETVFDEPVKEDELEKWRENPDEFDIEGVDTDESILFRGDEF